MTQILVIEDDPDIRDIILEILDLEDFETLSADNGLNGLDQARKYLPDLVISDIKMPELDGYGLLQALRNDSGMKRVPLVLISAKCDRDSILKGMNMGANDYLTKPFTRDQLLLTVSTQLQKSNNMEKVAN